MNVGWRRAKDGHNSRPEAPIAPRGDRRVLATVVVVLGLLAAPASQALLAHPHASTAAAKKRQQAKAHPLGVPRLQSPGNNASVQSLPTFTWAAVKGANRYQFQLSADKRFGAVIANGASRGAIETENTAATVEKAVPNGVYYWRVRAVGKQSSGRWSSARKLSKTWSAAPQDLSPAGTTVDWPGQPLVFRWSSVPHAVKYQLTVATDPALANQVIGTKLSPVTTDGTAYAPNVALDPGTYYWRVTPIDAQGHAGAPSDEGTPASFSYTWQSATSPQVSDLNPNPQVFDPLFKWAPIAGAARYEVEVNSSEQFSPGSKWCCTGTTVGTSMAPLKTLANNRYYWRVRGIDAKGHAGQWNEGPSFTKAFDSVTPSISELTLRDPNGNAYGAGEAPETDTPIVTWTPVPGASLYQVQVAPYRPLGCEWSAVASDLRRYQAETATPAWTPLSEATKSNEHIGLPAWPIAENARPLRRELTFTADETLGSGTLTHAVYPEEKPEAGDLVSGPGIPAGAVVEKVEINKVTGNTVIISAGATETGHVEVTAKPRYCVQVNARSDNDAQNGQVASEPTQLNGLNEPAFTFTSSSSGAAHSPFVAPPEAYLQPRSGTLSRLTPYFTWEPVEGANGYYVVIARDAGFTEVADVGFTEIPAYAPRLANESPLSDETTTYYWAVIPATGADGSGAFSANAPQTDSPQTFEKESLPPTLIGPGDGATIENQPTFEWAGVENARNYRIQIATDPNFGQPLEDVTTDATAYAPTGTYPANTTLYWRVRGNDWSNQGLAWSPTRRFVRTLPTPQPAPAEPAGGELIPTLNWSPVQGAIGYEVRVTKVNGQSQIFNFPATSGTPIEWFGVGIWRWQVRAVFPGANAVQTVPGPYSALQPFVRTLNAPSGVRGVRAGGRMIVSWNADPAAKQYEVDVATSDGFATTINSHRTDNTSWAPQLVLTSAEKKKTLYWRVAAVDANGNVGSFAAGTFAAPRASCSAAGGKAKGKHGKAKRASVKKPAACKTKKATKKRR